MRIPAFLAGVAGLAFATPGLAQPAASPSVELTEERREVEPLGAAAEIFPEHRDRFGDDLKSYGIQANLAAGLAHAWELELGSMLGSRIPVPIKHAHIALDGIGWTAGGTIRPFYQWEDGWRGSVAMHARGFGSFDVTQSGAARGAQVRFAGGNAVAFEATFGHAFSLRTSYAYVELGIEAQIVSVDLSVHLEGTGYVGDTRLYSLAFAPVPRVGWFIPIDNDFYADLTLDYRPTGLGGVGAGIGIGMSD